MVILISRLNVGLPRHNNGFVVNLLTTTIKRRPLIQISLRLCRQKVIYSCSSGWESPDYQKREGKRSEWKLVQRLPYRKWHSYATKSNKHRVVKTPGGKLVYQTTKKRASGPKSPVTGKRIQEYRRSRLSRNRRTVNRDYGGVLSGAAVRERIIGAFLVEEQKIVKKVMKIQKAKEKLASKS